MIRGIAVAAFLVGLLLAVRVMFFGVRRQLSEDLLYHRKWPLAIAAFLATSSLAKLMRGRYQALIGRLQLQAAQDERRVEVPAPRPVIARSWPKPRPWSAGPNPAPVHPSSTPNPGPPGRRRASDPGSPRRTP